jgi:hypothetical protein
MDNVIDGRKWKISQPRETRVALSGKGRSLKATTESYVNAGKRVCTITKE